MKFARSPYQPLKQWLTAAILVLGLVGFVFVAVQQNYRTSANDPQIQLAHDAADSLSSGTTTAVLLQNMQPIDIARSLAPFEIIYDHSGHELTSTGKLHGATPVLPAGVQDYTKTHGEDRFTWQPQAGVREAAVLVHQGQYYVLAARSLREVEQREHQLTLMAGLAAAFLLAATGVIIRFFQA
jgi:hypothetical protein